MTRFKRWLTYAPATTGLPLGSSPLRGQRAPGSVSGRPLGPPSAQSPFARRGCDPRPSGVPHRFDQRYPVFVAPTGSCARPKPSRRFRSPYTTGLRRLRPAPAGRWSFPTLFPAILVWVLGPLPRGALQVRLSVPSLETPVFAPRECARRTKPPRTAAATRYLDFGAVAIPFPFRPPHSLDLQAAPTAAHLRAGRPGRLHHASPGWLPAPGCGIASCPTRTIDTAGLPPAGLQLCRLLLAGAIHLPHTAFADLGGDLIRTQGRSRRKRHDQLTGTRSVSSWNQLMTTLSCSRGASLSLSTNTKDSPSGDMS